MAGLEGRRRPLFYEQWHAVRSRDGLLDQLARQRLVADDGAGEIAAIVVVKALKHDAPDHQRAAANGSRPAGDHKENRRVADLSSDALDDLDRRWIGPVKILYQYQARVVVGVRRQLWHNRNSISPTPPLRLGHPRS